MASRSFSITLHFTSSPHTSFMCRLFHNVFALFGRFPSFSIFSHELIFIMGCYDFSFMCFPAFYTTSWKFISVSVFAPHVSSTTRVALFPDSCALLFFHMYFLQHVPREFHIYVLSFSNMYHQCFMCFDIFSFMCFFFRHACLHFHAICVFQFMCLSFHPHVILPPCAAWIFNLCGFFLQHISPIFHVFGLFLIYVLLFPSCVFALSCHLCFSMHVFVFSSTCNSPSMCWVNF